MKKIYFLIFSFLILGYFAPGYCNSLQLISYPNFYDNPLLNDKMRKLMAPHLLPIDHPIKEKLDILFSQTRVTQNQQTLIDAGFVILTAQPKSYVIVAQHPEFPGYIFKLYLDTELRKKYGVANWRWLTRRCIGAQAIRKVIKKNKLKYFIVPDKWLYILPQYPMSQEPNPQPVILIETYIELGENSEHAWKTRIKYKHLDELYLIFKSGYGSTHVTANAPYTKNKKFAFIDTESPKRKPTLKRVKLYLSRDMQHYWDALIHE